MQKIFFKSAHLLCLAICLALAGLQLNDPDPLLWSLFYAICGLPALLSLFSKKYSILNWIILVCCSAMLAYTASGLIEFIKHMENESLLHMSADKPYIEEAREFGGALFVTVLVGIYQWRNRY